jgi:hypothetical protein
MAMASLAQLLAGTEVLECNLIEIALAIIRYAVNGGWVTARQRQA